MTSSPDKPKLFVSPAFLLEVEPGLFGLFRSILVEDREPRTGKMVREKVRDVGPIRLFRECERDETPTLRSHHPTTSKPLALVEVKK